MSGRRLPAVTVDWEAWTLIGELIGMGPGHVIYVVAERFLAAESPDEAVEQMIEELALLAKLSRGDADG